MTFLNEELLEKASIRILDELGFSYLDARAVAPGEREAERTDFSEVVLVRRLEDAIARLNPAASSEAREEALRKVLRVEGPSLVTANQNFHRMLSAGVPVEARLESGRIGGDHIRLADFENPTDNDLLVMNQFTVKEGQYERRPDLVVFVNGLPIAVLELKNAASEGATIHGAFNQLQTYKEQIPSLFKYNQFLVISDGLQARMGSLTASMEWFKVWRTVEGESEAPATSLELEVMLRGLFEPTRLLSMMRNFIAFENDAKGRTTKLIAGYHQFHAVNKAVEQMVRASKASGDRRVGVVWHTQGSGKSLSMLYLAGRAVREPAMENPTIVLLTDRNDLDDQLFGQFQRASDVVGQKPKQALNRSELREMLKVASGGVVFTTIQKFMPEDRGDRMPCLSERRNIVVIADEAHRSQYDLIDGLARHMHDALPNASYIGFTGTPIETTDANTRAIFGDYIDVYDIQQAVADGATVPIYYESRIAKLSLLEDKLPDIDEDFEDLAEGIEDEQREKLKTKWAALEKLVGDPKRIAVIAKDLVEHYERRDEAIRGKAMVVCMSRRICIDLLNAILKLRPDWASAEGDNEAQESGKKHVVKVVMTGSATDELSWQPHIRNKQRRGELALRFKDPSDPFSIVIVRDMWLTGFDAPCLSTMYIDKPMRGHSLMQAIARVNRVFKDKPGGLVVDYLGLADQLKSALATYTAGGGRGNTTETTETAVRVLTEKCEVAAAMLHGLDWTSWRTAGGLDRLKLLPSAQEHLLAQDEGKKRFTTTATEISRAFALCATRPEAIRLRDDISFYQAVAAALKKTAIGSGSDADLDHAIQQLVSGALAAPGEVIDVFAAAGLKRPDISILSEEFLKEVAGMKHKNLAAEILAKLLAGEIKAGSSRNVVQSRAFSEMLKKTINAYHNRAIATQEVIEELIKLAREIDQAKRRGQILNLSEEELAFYDALAANESAVQTMGNKELQVIATELVSSVRKSVTIDWTLRENARAKIRVIVKRILKQYGYPPDLQDEAVQTVLQQAEVLCKDWAA